MPVGTVADAVNCAGIFRPRRRDEEGAAAGVRRHRSSTEDSVKARLELARAAAAIARHVELARPVQERSATLKTKKPRPRWRSSHFKAPATRPSSSKNDPYTRVVTRGWNWLLRRQQEDGHFFANLAPEQHQLYTQALCTIAICELYGMTRDETYLEPAQKAVDYCVKIQSPEGGWRYQPGVDSDLSVTGWFAMAMQSARMAGIEVPSPVFDRIGKFLDSVARDEGARYALSIQRGRDEAAHGGRPAEPPVSGLGARRRAAAQRRRLLCSPICRIGTIATCTTGTTARRFAITWKARIGRSGTR